MVYILQHLHGFRLGMRIRDPREHQQYQRHSSRRKIDIETPPPRGVLRKRAAYERTKDKPQLRKSLTDPHQHRPLMNGYTSGNDGKGSVLQARSTHACDGAADNEHLGRYRDAAEETAEFEDQEEGDEGPFVLEIDHGVLKLVWNFRMLFLKQIYL